MDIATFVGFLCGATLLFYATLGSAGGMQNMGMYWDWSSAMLVYGGTFGSVFVGFPFSDVVQVFKVAINAFRHKPVSPVRIINDMVRYAEVARRDGILALESVTGEITDEFMVKGIQLAVDGTDPALIESILSTELDWIMERHRKGKQIFDTLAKYAPAYGMLGTLIGLVAMLKNLTDPAAIGPGMALALLTTMYGALGAYFVFIPVADKLDNRSREEYFVKQIVIRGVLSIQSGDNPRIVEQQLKTFLPPRARAAAERRR
ncbi:MAG: MotA/TolQ/ExbB proton channel family protein [Planctomycetes bacterium]|nr:MotA/TolQ/ExbB proton channel family protein [Planctomycetota bacterium]